MLQSWSLLALLMMIVAACGEKAADIPAFTPECMVLEKRGEVSVNFKGMKEGTRIDVEGVPSLSYTINRSGIYMQRAPFAEIPPGPTTLTVRATLGDASRTASCTFERPKLPVKLELFSTKGEPYARAGVVVTITRKGSDGKPDRAALRMPLDESGRYVMTARTWKPTDVKVDGQQLEPNDKGTILVPLPATEGGTAKLELSNPDGDRAEFEVKVERVQPWRKEDLKALRAGGEGGLSWASPRNPGAGPRPLLVVGEYGDVLSTGGPLRVTADVELVAQVRRQYAQVEACKYVLDGRAPGDAEAEIVRKREIARVVLREAKTGNELARTELTADPKPCPDKDEFLVLTNKASKKKSTVNPELRGDALPAALAWVEAQNR